MRKFMLALGAMAMMAPMLMVPEAVLAKTVHKQWRGKDGRMYCRRSDGTVGAIAGGVAGVLVGRSIDTRGDRTLGTLGGAAAGALAGRAIDREVSKKPCR